MKRTGALGLVVAIGLLCAAGAHAALFTVGPGGTHATIAAALDAAIAAGGGNEVRVASGTYAENLAPTFVLTSFAITMSGGWNAAFTTRVTDPAATVIDGSGTEQCLDITLRDQALILEGLTFTRGAGPVEGAVTIIADGASDVEVRNCRFVGNTVQGGTVAGGGMVATAGGTTSLLIRDCEFTGNVLESTSNGGATGAGLWLSGYVNGSIEVAGNVIADNTASATGNQVTGVGMYLDLGQDSTADVHDNLFARNLVATPGGGPAIGSGAVLWTSNNAHISAARNSWLGNGTSTTAGQEQVSVSCNNQSSVSLTDSLIAAGADINTRGVDLSGRDTSTIRMTNCTVAEHNLTGLSAGIESGTVTIANTIVTGNSPDMQVDAGVAVTTTMVGGDPLFVDPPHWDFRLRSASTAVGAGSLSPPGGLGSLDLAGATRVYAGTVERGAYEFRQPTSRFPVVTHAAGFGGTPWRTAFTGVNATGSSTEYEMTYTGGGAQPSVGGLLAAHDEDLFGDVVVSPFGFPSSASNSGSLMISTRAGGAVFASRTYADPGAGMGTYGQFLEAVPDAAMLQPGATAVIPLARSDAGYYTNIGMVNGSIDFSCTATVRLFDATGAQVGSTRTMTATPWGWTQLSDVFALAAAGSHSVAYATVQVTSADTPAWFYASVIDRLTKDPTTVPMQVAVAAGTVLRLPAAAHISGAGGTPWRTTSAVVNRGSGTANVTLVYRSGATVVTKSASIPAGAVRLWDDLLVDLFAYGEGASTSGSVELWADQPLAVAGRSYADKGAAGTYGQALPALQVWRDGIGSLSPGVLAALRKDASFYTNVGFVNLGAADCQVRVTLFSSGTTIGSAVTKTVGAGQWLQVNDVFAEAGAGGAEAAHAVVEVLTPGGRVWAYASVIDVISRDPTTVPLVRPWVIGPPIK